MPQVAGVKRSINLAMVEIGRFNTLTVVKIVDFGVYLDGGERGEILMPKEYVPANCFPDDEVKAFVYFDSEDRIVATTEHPHVMVGEFAFLKVVALSPVGAFSGLGIAEGPAGAFPGAARSDDRREILFGVCLSG